MDRSSIKTFWLVVMLMVGMLSCGGGAPPQQESRQEKMKPKAGDKLSKLMDRNWDNLEYIMYGFINYDTEKIKTATTNLAAISEYMAKRISPQHQKYRAEWNEQCNLQRELAANMKREFEEQNFDASRNYFKKLTGNCMECHKIYRKHLLKPKEEEATP